MLVTRQFLAMMMSARYIYHLTMQVFSFWFAGALRRRMGNFSHSALMIWQSTLVFVFGKSFQTNVTFSKAEVQIMK